jgi:hypothetical protein
MADQALNYLIELISVLALPAFILIIATWRVARLRSLTPETLQERVDASVSDTLKEQLQRVVTPLFEENNVILPPGKDGYDVIEFLVPGDNVQLLAEMYTNLSQLGVESHTYLLLIQAVNTLGG